MRFINQAVIFFRFMCFVPLDSFPNNVLSSFLTIPRIPSPWKVLTTYLQCDCTILFPGSLCTYMHAISIIHLRT